jgi:IMP dehydrogenase|tara:strand:+ start:568 stop:1608 length:1041 start_codon:yes stop_codon:yes gene_type:complete
MITALTYDDVLLVPRFSDIESRSEIVLDSDLDNRRTLTLPIISSPMDTITGAAMASTMALNGGLGIIHRYNTPDEQASIVFTAKRISSTINKKDNLVGAAIGVSGDYLDRARKLVKAGADIICIDIAHGHHILMQKAIRDVRTVVGTGIHIMAGNVATKEGYEDLSRWGADSVRCNVGGGSICSTRIQAGSGYPGLQTLFDCSSSDFSGRVPIIADGGIRNSGDIVKALAAGADFVMLGSLLSGTEETPSDTIEVGGETRKVYRGMASREAQLAWRGKTSSLEGVATTVAHKGSVEHTLSDLERGIRSGLSYSGARTIEDFQTVAEFVRQTRAGTVESGTHIMRVL